MGPATQQRRRTRAGRPASRRHRAAAADDGDVGVRCEACGSGDDAEELLLCDGCDRGLHIFCLRPILPRVPAGDWFCPSCAAPTSSTSAKSAAVQTKMPKQFPLIQTKIVDFFKIQRRPTAAATKKRKRKSAGSLPFTPSEDPVRRVGRHPRLVTLLAYSDDHVFCLKRMWFTRNSHWVNREQRLEIESASFDALFCIMRKMYWLRINICWFSVLREHEAPCDDYMYSRLPVCIPGTNRSFLHPSIYFCVAWFDLETDIAAFVPCHV